jgi:hypothetical protein
MKKSKLLVLGLIALMLVGGLVLAGCGSSCPNDSCGKNSGSADCKEPDCARFKKAQIDPTGDYPNCNC